MSFTPETLHRQWNTLRLIPRNPRKISATELHKRLAKEGFRVGKRTVERDLQSLAIIFPLSADERSKPFGWSWQKDAPVFDLPGLTNSQALTMLLVREHLRMLIPSSVLAQLEGFFALAEQTLSNLDGRVGAATWLGKVKVIPSTQALLPPQVNSDVQTVVYDALLLDRQCLIEYLGRDKLTSEQYPIHPLGLVQRGQVIYLVCTIKTYPDIRILAMHRIRNAQAIDTPAERPDTFKFDDYLKSGALDWFPQKVLCLEAFFSADIASHLMETPLSEEQDLQKMPDGRFLLRANVRETKQLIWWLQGFGASVEVVKPVALRQQLYCEAKRMLELYEG
ncbi:helix-turn-helix transcriptional regulator [Undibacterium sp. SXout7W]|uniref:helix-turn-helix transcriptional regulator n=1 Tax=Undibacterium sp. SXout7W TaxID=3413049 RepID=UPI003BEF64E3